MRLPLEETRGAAAPAVEVRCDSGPRGVAHFFVGETSKRQNAKRDEEDAERAS